MSTPVPAVVIAPPPGPDPEIDLATLLAEPAAPVWYRRPSGIAARRCGPACWWQR